MIKTPKPTGHSASPDTPNINTTNTGNRSVPIPGSSGAFAPGTHQLPGTFTPHSSGSEVTGYPGVVVSDITLSVITETNARLADIALPESEIHLLQPHESVDGFFVHLDGQTYAHLEEGVHYRVKLNAAGDYQIPWPEAQGVTPPILKKIDGQPRWRIEAPWYMAQSRQSNLPVHQQSAETSLAMFLLDANLATLLPAAKDFPDGIRPGPRRSMYIDIAEGTVQVSKKEGAYKLASSSTNIVPDITFEQIPGHFLWRRKLPAIADTQQDPQPGSSRALTQPEEFGPGPSKHPRLQGDSDPLDPMPTSELWNSWGSTTQPLVGDSIEIDGRHFAILDQPGHATEALVFIKPPQFSATRFDAFEQMLLTTPELQPRRVMKLADRRTGLGSDTWRIVEGLPFAKSLTQIVSNEFSYLSAHSANKVAREMFNRANDSDEMTGPGINALFETMKYWENRFGGDNRHIRQDLIDPLMLLSPLPTDANGNRPMPLPSAEGLQRIDFNPNLLSGSQYQSHRQTTRILFKDLLGANGYQILHNFGVIQGNALLISRTGVDHVFIMFMDKVPNYVVRLFNPITWLEKIISGNKKSPQNRMDTDVKENLREHLRTNRIIFLLGTNEPLLTHEPNLIVTRHS
ncbi:MULTISPECIES: hypothetical protein [unclassified Pseudomonas]|uniref:hypothetical protein n=1 Tax=unclassified Pseudomonas TaxID=196821 RepID=UPI002892F253|nr:MULTISPECIES: hypothetical protein [unclassified Pseudomonas]